MEQRGSDGPNRQLLQHSLAWCGDTDAWDWEASFGFCSAWDIGAPDCRPRAYLSARDLSWASNRCSDRAWRRAESHERDVLHRSAFAIWARVTLVGLCSWASHEWASSHRRCNGRDRSLRRAEAQAACAVCLIAFAAWATLWGWTVEARYLWADACLRRGFVLWKRTYTNAQGDIKRRVGRSRGTYTNARGDIKRRH